MVVNNKISVMLLFVLGSLLNGNTQSTDVWNLKFGTNYAHGFITENTQTMQLHGTLGFEKEKFEARVDGFYFLGQQGDRERFSENNQLFLGGYYYFTNGNFRPYAGAQIGVAYAKSTEYGILNYQNQLQIESATNPVFAFGAGIDYKLNTRFDLNIECRQIFGKHTANSYSTYLDELRISIGLGFYLINKSTN